MSTSDQSGTTHTTARPPTLGILELGTNSLKLHRAAADGACHEPLRVEWEVGIDACSARRFGESSIDDALTEVRRLVERAGLADSTDLLGVATGIFAEAENTAQLLGRIHEALGIPVRVLSGGDQAELLYTGFAEHVEQRPAMLFDLGCGRLEAVHLGAGSAKRYIHESLPIGVIRVHHVASFGLPAWSPDAARRFIRETLRDAKLFDIACVHGTGGSVRVVAQVADTPNLTTEVLACVEEEARANGPPRFLSPRRQAIFLPGVVILRELLEHVGARELRHHKVDLGMVLVKKMLPFHNAMGAKLRQVFVDPEIDIVRW